MITKSRKTGERTLRFSLGHQLHFSGATTIDPGKWQHIAVVFRGTGNIDGDMVDLYLNGERELVDHEIINPPKDDRVIKTVIRGPNSQPLQIGCGPYLKGNISPYFGDIDEVWILPRALSAREVKGLMRSSKDGLPAK